VYRSFPEDKIPHDPAGRWHRPIGRVCLDMHRTGNKRCTEGIGTVTVVWLMLEGMKRPGKKSVLKNFELSFFFKKDVIPVDG
jgi:hypothetical protein